MSIVLAAFIVATMLPLISAGGELLGFKRTTYFSFAVTYLLALSGCAMIGPPASIFWVLLIHGSSKLDLKISHKHLLSSLIAFSLVRIIFGYNVFLNHYTFVLPILAVAILSPYLYMAIHNDEHEQASKDPS